MDDKEFIVVGTAISSEAVGNRLTASKGKLKRNRKVSFNADEYDKRIIIDGVWYLSEDKGIMIDGICSQQVARINFKFN